MVLTERYSLSECCMKVCKNIMVQLLIYFMIRFNLLYPGTRQASDSERRLVLDLPQIKITSPAATEEWL